MYIVYVNGRQQSVWETLESTYGHVLNLMWSGYKNIEVKKELQEE